MINVNVIVGAIAPFLFTLIVSTDQTVKVYRFSFRDTVQMAGICRMEKYPLLALGPGDGTGWGRIVGGEMSRTNISRIKIFTHIVIF